MNAHNTKGIRQRINPAYLALGALGAFLLFLFLRNSDVAIKSVSDGLTLCASSIVPSLFPFMVISEMIVSSDFASFVGTPLTPLFKRLFGLSKNGCAPLLLGILCGFPIGARSAYSLYKKGLIQKNEYERLLAFTNTPSSAFLINAVGVSMFGDRSFGIALYFISLFSSLSVGVLYNLLLKKKYPIRDVDQNDVVTDSTPPTKIIYSAVTSSAMAIIYVSAFIIFFSALTGTLEYVFSSINIPDYIEAISISLLEMTGGIKKASLTNGGKLIAAFAAGWSGLSVHFQIMSISYVDGISFKPYFISKALQGGLNVLLTYLWIILFG